MAPQLHATPVSVQRMQRCSTGYKIVLYSIVLAKKKCNGKKFTRCFLWGEILHYRLCATRKASVKVHWQQGLFLQAELNVAAVALASH